MSKELKALKEIIDYARDVWEEEYFDFDIIAKALKALEIIANNTYVIEHIDPKNNQFYVLRGTITGAEYQVLSEVLKEKKDDLLREVLND